MIWKYYNEDIWLMKVFPGFVDLFTGSAVGLDHVTEKRSTTCLVWKILKLNGRFVNRLQNLLTLGHSWKLQQCSPAHKFSLLHTLYTFFFRICIRCFIWHYLEQPSFMEYKNPLQVKPKLIIIAASNGRKPRQLYCNIPLALNSRRYIIDRTYY